MGMLAHLVLGAAALSAQPLAPSGKWVVDYAENACVLQRAFGEGEAKLMFGVRPPPLGSHYEIVVLHDRSRGRWREGKAAIRLSLATEPIEAHYTGVDLPDGGGRLTRFNVDWAQLEALPASDHVTIDAGEELSITVAPKGMQAALAALEACRVDLLTTYGLDPAALAAIAKPAEPITPTNSWVRVEDYPTESIRRGLQGVSMILWTIELDGRAGGCRVLVSSGHESLDNAACNAVTKRGRYRPALDREGRPIVSWDSRRVRWSNPN